MSDPTHDIEDACSTIIGAGGGSSETLHSEPPFIEMLPPEILAEVFIHCTMNDSDAPMTLQQVCRTWRDISRTCSTVWRSLTLSDRLSSLNSVRAKADLWLSRSNVIPLDFRITYDSTESLLPMLSYILPAVGRWHEGTLVGKGALMARTSYQHNCQESNLNLLSIIVISPDDVDIGLGLGREGQIEPEANTLTFNQGDHHFAFLTVGIHALPSPSSMAPLVSLTDLTIGYYNYDTESSLHKLLAFLTVCPSLEIFRFDNGLSQDPEPAELCIGVPITTLSHLHTMSLRSFTNSRCFLSHISTPALESLALIHINTAVEFASSHRGEPGDSDDEAHDFSQSPWTDHATGMGLRSLCSRCNPPLRELNMDYADLRTKDFKWAFTQFRSLESLRVVASDMSDNVARALQPTEGWAPLPHLTHLELRQCQKLSGAAIEQMIKSRFETGRKGLVTPMEKVQIINCADFSESNYHSVARVFKPRSGLIYIRYETD